MVKPIIKTNMHGVKYILLLFPLLLFSSCEYKNEKQKDVERKTNIILIVADDAGYSDFSCYGSEISTPNIDALSKEGLQLTDFHVTPNCAPTRASLLSGMDNHLVGLGTMSELITDNQKGKKGYEGYLNFDVVSLPEVLKLSGYNTYMAGKWHLGAKDPKNRPHARGFDKTFSMLAGGASHWQDNTPLIPGKPSPYSVNGEIIKELPDDFYSSKNYTDSIISYIDTDINGDKPFFAYLAFTAPHNPLHAPKDYINKYDGKYDEGFIKIAENRLNKMKDLGLISKEQNLTPYPEWLTSWEELTDEQKSSRAKDMEVYAAMIDYMDMSIGRLIDYLKKIGEYDNTLIIVMSDNGASKTTINDYASLNKDVENHLKKFDNSIHNKGQVNSAIDIGPGWAWTANTPFFLTKGYPTEGGMRVPCIVKAPKKMNISPRKHHGFTYVSDLMPTLLELTHSNHPSKYNGHTVLPMQGVTQLSNWKNEIEPSRDLGFEIYGMTSFRSNHWKILRLPKPYGTGEWQLFNLENDISEQINLANEYPQKKEELIKRYHRYAKNNGIIIPEKKVGYAKPPKAGSY